MNPERWQQIDRLYHAALELDSEHRDEFLLRVCEGDEGLRRELQSLLQHDIAVTSPFDTSAWESAEGLLSMNSSPEPGRGPLDAGTQLGPYRIVSRIGVGGMGEVYRAQDLRLGREVALKVLTAEVADDPRRRQRFEGEAHAVAALSHPNIIAIYDVGEENGIFYMVTELVDGESLRGLRFPLRKTLDMPSRLRKVCLPLIGRASRTGTSNRTTS